MTSGNPVSATVTAHLYVLPACRRIGGQERPFPALVRARLSDDDGGVIGLDPRPEYRRVHLSWKPGEAVAEARATRGHQMSSRYCTDFSQLLFSQFSTAFFIQSFARFHRLSFGNFPRLVG